MNILGHTSHVGNTGYNNHSKGFFRELKKQHNIKLRNFTIGPNWRGIEHIDPHSSDINEDDKMMLYTQTLFNGDSRQDYPLYGYIPNFIPDVHIVLNTVDHYYFYDQYLGKKIAYNVWENSLYPETFFNKLREFDQVWVASEWQKEITIKQGISRNKVKVVPEGVEDDCVPGELNDEIFRFIIIGAWCERKSTKELIQSFIHTFGNKKGVELILCVENPFLNDGCQNTQERLNKHNLFANNIRILPFLSRQEYIKLLQSSHVFLSCAKGEGWNLPLMEAAACGMVCIYSNCGGQLEYMKDKGLPVSIKKMTPALFGPGEWFLPDFEELDQMLLYVYQKYHELRRDVSLPQSALIQQFSWKNSAEIANKHLKELTNLNLLASCSYVGSCGFNSLAQNFLPALNNHVNVSVRNFTVGDNWTGYSFEPHNQDIKESDKNLLLSQTLVTTKGYEEFPIYNKDIPKIDIHLIMNEVNHRYFYDQYSGRKIAYTMNETTEFPNDFLNKLREFDQVWVPSTWQKNCLIHQGFNANNVRIVPLGVDGNLFNCTNKNLFSKFTFGLFGRWDFRKSTLEIIQCFQEVFGENSDVELLISVDNPHNIDGLNSTEERLKHYGITAKNIKILHFPDKKSYIEYLKNIHVFVSCSKGEGWNLPLIEAMACGTPSIYSNCSGQTEFAMGLGIPVSIEKNISSDNPNQFNNCPGEYYLPDWKRFKHVLLEVYDNYSYYQNKAKLESLFIIDKFSWSNSSRIAFENLKELESMPIKFTKTLEDNLGIQYKNVSSNPLPIKIIISNSDGELFVDNFIINSGIEYFSKLNDSKNLKYPLKFKITNSQTGLELLQHSIDIPVINISNESGSLGDSIAWISAVDTYQKVKNCKINYYTPYKELFISIYPNLNILDYSSRPTQVDYKLEYFDAVLSKSSVEYNLQELAYNILGIPEKWNWKNPEKSKISLPNLKNQFNKKYVCIATQSTSQCKYWNNPMGWQLVCNYLQSLGYEVVCIDKYKSFGINGHMNTIPSNCIDKTGDLPLSDRINDLYYCDFFIGLSSGLSWLAWAMNKPILLISGFTSLENEFYTPYRPYNTKVCHGCWNDKTVSFDPSNWLWCPKNKNFECSKQISFSMVKQCINQLINDLNINS